MTKVKLWKDEQGQEIPVSRITKSEKNREAQSMRLLKLAEKQNKLLVALKKDFHDTCQSIYDAALAENKIDKKDRKGNFTWYNFDRSIKVERSVNEAITFDEMNIGLAKDTLMAFIDSSVQGIESFIKDLIMEAFATSKGKLDTSKIMALLKHRSKIKDERFQKACDLIEEAIRKPGSRVYFRIWKKDDQGKYQSIDLNISSIEFKTTKAEEAGV